MLHSFAHSRFAAKTTDLLVIGGGPGGYAAAIRAAKLGMKTICVEKENLMGGTCLREGCIPSKYFLNMSHKVYEANNVFRQLGIKIPGKATVDMAAAQRRKNGVIKGLSQGIEFLIKKSGGELIKGKAHINSKNSVTIKGNDGKVTEVAAKNMIIATGTDKWYPKSFPVDEDIVATSQGVLNWKTIPKSLCVIGSGIIGLELGSVFASLGTKVTMFDMMKTIGGPSCDAYSARYVQNILKKRGIDFQLGHGVDSLTKTSSGTVEVMFNGQKFESERALVAIGRKLNLDGFGLENLNLKRTGRGLIDVSKKLETSVKGVYAIGDIVPGPQLAHKAEEEGIACVEMMNGLESSYNPDVIPAVIYTSPEIASVGLTQDDARKKGIRTRVGQFPYQANSRARAILDSNGFVKFVCAEDGKVLGMQIVGPNAGEAIMEGAIAIKNNLKIDAIADTCHPHPTLSEAVLEAAKGVLGKAIHI